MLQDYRMRNKDDHARPTGSVSERRLSLRRTFFTFLAICCGSSNDQLSAVDSDAEISRKANVATNEWPQWGGASHRNNASPATNLATAWDIKSGKNIKWVARLGSQTNGTPVIAGGKLLIGTNNAEGYLKRIPANIDCGCLLCFDAGNGRFLWQYSSLKLPSGRTEDWPNQGISSTPLVQRNRVWFVSNRCEIVCLDTNGFADNVNDGPYKKEHSQDINEADIIWKVDMKREFGVIPRHMSNSSPTCVGNTLFVCTSNGRQKRGIASNAPSFIALNKQTGEVLWTDASPGTRILHGQWSSPAGGTIGGVPQIVFAGGDGWLYSFDPKGSHGRSHLLWKFDCNPKRSKWILGSRGDRNNLLSTPVLYNNHVYIAVGQDPEHGEGDGRLWCVTPMKRGDVSPEIAVQSKDATEDSRKTSNFQKNLNSAAVWKYDRFDRDGDGTNSFEETMHRTICTVALRHDLLVVGDFSGVIHCLDAKTGRPHWAYDALSPIWGSPLIADGRIYIATEEGHVIIVPLTSRLRPTEIHIVEMENSIRSTPVAVSDVLYIATASRLHAIQKGVVHLGKQP